MTSPRTSFRIVLAGSLLLAIGCGGTTPEVDTAETIKTDPNKPASTPTPTPTPEVAPGKEAPKG